MIRLATAAVVSTLLSISPVPANEPNQNSVPTKTSPCCERMASRLRDLQERLDRAEKRAAATDRTPEDQAQIDQWNSMGG